MISFLSYCWFSFFEGESYSSFRTKFWTCDITSANRYLGTKIHEKDNVEHDQMKEAHQLAGGW